LPGGSLDCVVVDKKNSRIHACSKIDFVGSRVQVQVFRVW
jgi:alpha-D-ribose 1-methylphosphonate 5-phosphate C-P lyase